MAVAEKKVPKTAPWCMETMTKFRAIPAVSNFFAGPPKLVVFLEGYPLKSRSHQKKGGTLKQRRETETHRSSLSFDFLYGQRIPRKLSFQCLQQGWVGRAYKARIAGLIWTWPEFGSEWLSGCSFRIILVKYVGTHWVVHIVVGLVGVRPSR